MLVGPMDYTPGAFDLDGTETNPKYVKTTRAQQVAMFVIYYSPLQMIVDYPDVYRQNKEHFQFLLDIPTTWDETKFIAGEPGEYIVMARKSSDRWFIGAMTNEQSRRVTISLAFLEDSVLYNGRILVDAEDAGVNPEHVTLHTRTYEVGDRITLHLQNSGGGAVILSPKDK